LHSFPDSEETESQWIIHSHRRGKLPSHLPQTAAIQSVSGDLATR
jgi:hypothetical protein